MPSAFEVASLTAKSASKLLGAIAKPGALVFSETAVEKALAEVVQHMLDAIDLDDVDTDRNGARLVWVELGNVAHAGTLTFGPATR